MINFKTTLTRHNKHLIARVLYARRRITLVGLGKTYPRNNKDFQQLGFRRYVSSLSTRRYFSTEEDEEEKSKKQAFPWRHNSNLLPRIELGMLRDQNAGWRGKLGWAWWERSTAQMVIGTPVLELLGSEWRNKLAEDSTWAFASGIAALLSSTFKGMSYHLEGNKHTTFWLAEAQILLVCNSSSDG